MVSIELRFENEQQRDFWPGGLSDGWGENECNLTPLPSVAPHTYNVDVFHLQEIRRVELINKKFDTGLTPQEEAEFKILQGD